MIKKTTLYFGPDINITILDEINNCLNEIKTRNISKRK